MFLSRRVHCEVKPNCCQCKLKTCMYVVSVVNTYIPRGKKRERVYLAKCFMSKSSHSKYYSEKCCKLGAKCHLGQEGRVQLDVLNRWCLENVTRAHCSNPIHRVHVHHTYFTVLVNSIATLKRRLISHWYITIPDRKTAGQQLVNKINRQGRIDVEKML